MSQKFDELKKLVENADKSQITDIIQKVKQARDNGDIDKNEEQSLVDKAKEKAGGSLDLGKFGL